jgi:hypothetical protein
MALSIGGERGALWTPSGKDVRCGRRRINVCQSGSGSVGFAEKTALLQLYLEEVPPLGFELGDPAHSIVLIGSPAAEAEFAGLADGGSRIRTRDPTTKRKAMGNDPSKHRRLGPGPVSGSAFRVAVSNWQRPEEPFAGAGPRSRDCIVSPIAPILLS